VVVRAVDQNQTRLVLLLEVQEQLDKVMLVVLLLQPTLVVVEEAEPVALVPNREQFKIIAIITAVTMAVMAGLVFQT
jgi:hypothetical protein